MSEIRIAHKSLRRFALDLILASGADPEEAEIIADAYLWTDLVGRHTQGISRLPVYLKRLRLGLIKSPCRPDFIKHAEAVCIVDGHDGFGLYLGHVAMQKATEIAREYGIGSVGVRHSNHIGAAAYYVNLAAKNRQIGIALSNTFPRVAAHGGISAVLGTNPLAFGVPTQTGRPVLIDLSTSSISASTLRSAANDRKKVPAGSVVDQKGDLVVEAAAAVDGVIMPLGGAKGYCLGLIVEILCGVLTGAAISHEIGSFWKDFTKPANLGQFFIALDIEKFMSLEAFYKRMDLLIRFIKESQLQKETLEILIPGEIRWRNYNQNLSEGVPLDEKTAASLSDCASSLGIIPPW
jgi:ureidoglycolate dehydrogenase (NAD+)